MVCSKGPDNKRDYDSVQGERHFVYWCCFVLVAFSMLWLGYVGQEAYDRERVSK